jgi:hypothetical protein
VSECFALPGLWCGPPRLRGLAPPANLCRHSAASSPPQKPTTGSNRRLGAVRNAAEGGCATLLRRTARVVCREHPRFPDDPLSLRHWRRTDTASPGASRRLGLRGARHPLRASPADARRSRGPFRAARPDRPRRRQSGRNLLRLSLRLSAEYAAFRWFRAGCSSPVTPRGRRHAAWLQHPVCPNPPPPRSLGARSCTSTTCT